MGTAEDIAVELTPSPTDEVRTLVAALETELSADYLPEQRHGLKLEAIFRPHIRFYLARLGGEAVGCGGVAFLEGFAEVKRMYTRKDVRGRRIAEKILTRLEEEARTAGFRVLRLETGNRATAAIKLYERAGFRTCGAFGDYVAMPPHTIVTSVFMEKPL